MASSMPFSRGYSLVELLVVLAVVGILGLVGAVMLGNRHTGAVRAVMDELEGTLSGAHHLAGATGRDVLVVTKGEWGGSAPMRMAYGDAAKGSATLLADGAAASEAFHVAVNTEGALLREHMSAGVVTQSHANWWTAATNGLADLTAAAPFSDATTGFQGLLADGNNLFGGDGVGSVLISGTSLRFTSSRWIKVVSLSNGEPVKGGPVGVLVVKAGGGQVHRFYNPGVIDGADGGWRRL